MIASSFGKARIGTRRAEFAEEEARIEKRSRHELLRSSRDAAGNSLPACRKKVNNRGRNVQIVPVFIQSIQIMIGLRSRIFLYNSGMRSAALLALILVLPPIAVRSQDNHKASNADVDRWMTELSNWGRWGKDDQRGTLNLITPAKRKQAAASVKQGYSISLEHDVLTEKAVDNANPFTRTMQPGTGVFRMDTYSVSYHGLGQTHFDALCHANYHGKIYNGFSVDQVQAEGCPKDSVEGAKSGIMTRGVLIDIALLKGVPFLEPGTPIYPEDLDAWEKRTGVTVVAGDAVFIHTGRWEMRTQKGPSRTYAGLHASCAKWLHDHGVALLGSDAAQDVNPSQVEGVTLPIHQLALVAMGLPLLDNCDLEELSKEAQRRKQWTFLLTAAPLAVPGGTGSPLNPVATY